MSDAASKRAAWVEALKVERDGYARAGRKDRAAEVDAEIRKFTGEDAAPKGRRSPRNIEG